ncbi:MAG: ABC transporter substrate-binding protein [Candidatus Bipolaricaulota bacterium]|nr:ABC transporter substrate-binding protein [Candidatus Bipolaricaulota bacterium]MCS7275358.1 ABC transporter substrate-binding protein [Candidatus Bipolaricaulota bacterium]MDW8110143.1 ABC transporter substrate-binding protein [Candidatus Bipolaricaulota bacterium]MDW8329648.1 ABC transporter substrate-binding protein [Candidatus Bipolaricaulota bacterium]
MSDKTRFWILLGILVVVAAALILIAEPWKQQPPPSPTTIGQQPSAPSAPEPTPKSSPEPTPPAAKSEPEPPKTEPAPSPQPVTTPTPTPIPGRLGEIPPEPKVIGPNEGLVEPGIPGGRVVVGTLTGPKTFNPVVAQETSTTDVTGLLHGPLGALIEINPITAKEEPGLAKRWEISPDRREITFYLRKGIKWSDGHCCLSADDVVFTFNDLIFNPDVNTDDRDVFKIKDQYIKVEKIDDLTFKVIMPEPFRPIIRSLAIYVMPKHKLADKVAKLNPGAKGYLDGLKKVLEPVREPIREIAAAPLDLFESALAELEAVVVAKNLEKTRDLYAKAQLAFSGLRQALELQEQLDPKITQALEKAQDDLKRALEFAEAGQWEGVSPELFNSTWGIGTPAEEIVGLGPYRFVRYDVDQQIILERNPYYWKVDQNGVQLPYLDQFVFLVVQHLDTAFLKFKTGEIDTLGARPADWALLMEGVKDLDKDCYDKDELTRICLDRENKRRLILGGPGFGTLFLVLNQDAEDPVLREIFRDVRFRRALAHAMDKESMIDNIYNGLALPQWSPVSMLSPFYDKDETFMTYEFDLEKANKLLDEMGLTQKNSEGIRLRPDGKPLEFLLSTNQGNTLREKTAALLVDDFKKIGVKANFRPKDFNALVNDLTNAKYEAIIIGLTGGVDPHFGANVWRTDGGLHFWRRSSKENPPDWEKRVDELFDLAATTFDEEEAKEYYREFQRLVSENLPLIYTVNQRFLYAVKIDLANTEHFNPLQTIGQILGATDIVWWKDETRRKQ